MAIHIGCFTELPESYCFWYVYDDQTYKYLHNVGKNTSKDLLWRKYVEEEGRFETKEDAQKALDRTEQISHNQPDYFNTIIEDIVKLNKCLQTIKNSEIDNLTEALRNNCSVLEQETRLQQIRIYTHMFSLLELIAEKLKSLN